MTVILKLAAVKRKSFRAAIPGKEKTAQSFGSVLVMARYNNLISGHNEKAF